VINLNKCALKMAGRPAAQSTIVPNANVMNLQAIRQEIRNFSTLISTLHSNQASMEWLACRRLLHNEMHCAICNVGCRLNAMLTMLMDVVGSVLLVVPASLLDTVLRSHLTLQQVVIVIYCW